MHLPCERYAQPRQEVCVPSLRKGKSRPRHKEDKDTIPPETHSNIFWEGFWNYLADSNSIFVVAKFVLERFEFLVCSNFNHMQRDCTCARAVACLHPHNISNVIVSLTIHDNIFLYISSREM